MNKGRRTRTGYGGTGNPGPPVASLADVGAVLAGDV